MTKILTLKEFIASKVWSDNGDGADCFDGSGWRYADGWIEFNAGYWHLQLGNREYWTGDPHKTLTLEDLERRLYADHYLWNAGMHDLIESTVDKPWDKEGHILCPLMDAIGCDDGGGAEIYWHFDDMGKEPEEYWNEMDREERYEAMREYIQSECFQIPV